LPLQKTTAVISWLGFYIKIKNPFTKEKQREARMVPKFVELSELFKEYHDIKGHPGRDAMYASLRIIYGWDGLKKDVEKYLHTLILLFFRNKDSSSSSINCIELPEDPKTKMRYIFGIVDSFSRKLWAVVETHF